MQVGLNIHKRTLNDRQYLSPETLFALSDKHKPDSIPILAEIVAAICGHRPFPTVFHCLSWKFVQQCEDLWCSYIVWTVGLLRFEPVAWQDD